MPATNREWVLHRRRARRLAMLTVFAYLHSKDSMEEVKELLGTMARSYSRMPELTHELCGAVAAHKDELEADLQQVLENWRLERVGRVEHALLLLGAAEIAYFPDIPPRVTINEYLEISKVYCDANAPAFINGVLDKIVKLKGKPDFFVR